MSENNGAPTPEQEAELTARLDEVLAELEVGIATLVRVCGAQLGDTDGSTYVCDLPEGHQSWHLDGFKMVNERGDRLPCEMRWAPEVLAKRTGE